MPGPPDADPARSFAGVADAYDNARPTYPRDAVAWMVQPQSARVLELGAGTGKLTQQLVALGHEVIATDPLEPMLSRLCRRVPTARAVLSGAERIPLSARSVDVVIAAQAFHWFHTDRVLPEVARVLRPRGAFALVWNHRDDRVPWVRRLGSIIGDNVADSQWDPVRGLDDSGLFETVLRRSFRFWQPLTRDSLRDLVVSRSNVARMPEAERAPLLRAVDRLYEEYGRGRDGMSMPYLTHAYRTAVLPWAASETPESWGDREPSFRYGD